MARNGKLSTSIALIVALLSAISMVVVFFVADNAISSNLTTAAENNMVTSLNAKSKVIDEYISSAESLLKAYSKESTLGQAVVNVEDPDIQAAAQAYTMEFNSVLDGWEGLYICTWDTYVLTHSNPGTIGITMRKDDPLKALQDQVTAASKGSGISNSGIVASPASGNLVISMNAPVYYEGELVGMAGGACQAAGLKTLLDETASVGMDKASYSLINNAKKTYIFDSNEDLINTEVVDPTILSVIDDIAANKTESGAMEYTGDDTVEYSMVFKNLTDRGWTLIVKDPKTEIYASLTTSRTMLIIACAAGFLLLTILSWIVIRGKMSPLSKIANAINKLKELNLDKDDDIQKYKFNTNEIGRIAEATDSLTETFRDIIATLQQCSVSLSTSSDTMSNASGNLLDSVENNAAVTEELSASILGTNSSINSMTAEIAKMQHLAKAISESVKEGTAKTEELTETANSMSRMAADIIENNTAQIDGTKVKIGDAIDNLKALDKINEMANQILDITSRTNLLSLNASIEAARAGDAGVGFAVVASEIGNLADSSSETVNQIQEICSESNQSIESVNQCFDNIVSFMEQDISAQFGEFAKMAKEYADAVQGIREVIDRINKASTDFLAAVGNINVQVDQVSEASNNNAIGVDEIIDKNNSVTLTADDIVNITKENQKNAETLEEIIKRFQTTDLPMPVAAPVEEVAEEE